MHDSQHAPESPATAIEPMTMFLYVILVISIVGNTVTSFGGANIILHTAIGAVTLVCIGLLVARRLGRS